LRVDSEGLIKGDSGRGGTKGFQMPSAPAAEGPMVEEVSGARVVQERVAVLRVEGWRSQERRD